MPSWKKVITSGSDASLSSLTVTGGITGSLLGTASFAISASRANSALSSSYAVTASYALNATTSSYAQTASIALSSLNASDILIYVKNVTGASIAKGKVVRISGATGDNALISTASWDSDGVSANTLGIANETIANDAFGYVMTEGKLLGINTDSFTAGQLLFLGPTGSLIGSEPIPPKHAVRLGQVLRSQLNNGSMYVRIDNGYELDELHNVLIISGSDGDLLVASGSNDNGKKLYINSRQLTGSYGLTGSLSIDNGGITGSVFGTSSYATSALTASNSLTASYVNPLTQNVIVTGSLNINTPTGYPIYVSGSKSYLSIDTNATRTGTDLLAGELLIESTYDTGSSQVQFVNTAGNSVAVGVLGKHRIPSQANFGNARDGFLYASATTPVLHIINPATGASGSEDRHNDSIKLWAGTYPPNLTSSMLIMGTGSTKGNVSIGGVDPQNKLEVVGSVLATSITGSALLITGSTSDDLVRIIQAGSGSALNITHQTGTSATSIAQLYGGAIPRFNFRSDGLFSWGQNATGSSYGFLSWDTGKQTIGAVGVNNLSLFTNSGERMTISSSGLIGIGITTPSASLHITNTTTTNSFLVEDSTNPDATPFVIDNAGRVGIGLSTSSPYWSSASLQIVTSGSTPGTATALRIRESASNAQFNLTAFSSSIAGKHLRLSEDTTGQAVMVWTQTGEVGIGINATTVTPTAKLHINNTTPSASFLVEDTTNPDTTPFVITNTGLVGIGTTTPSASLDINGNVQSGYLTTASGTYSHAEGLGTIASGSYSHAEGYFTSANGFASHAEGYITIASGSYSHAEGANTVAFGRYSHAEGQSTLAIGTGSHAEGYLTTASANYSHAEGESTIAVGLRSHAEGQSTLASGDYSHAEGNATLAMGIGSHTEGVNTIASGNYSHAEGYDTIAYGYASHAEGYFTSASGDYSHAEGRETTASANYSHAEGYLTTTLSQYSHAEGYLTIASGSASHAEGESTIAVGLRSHAEGYFTSASGSYSHAEGNATVAMGIGSHTEGVYSTASGNYSHAEGDGTVAIGLGAHTEGYFTSASGSYSHAEGRETLTLGLYSHAEGFNTVASGSYQHVQGQYNISSSAQSAFIVGNGTSNGSRSNLIFASGSAVQITGSISYTQTLSGSRAYLSGSGGTISGSTLTVYGSGSTNPVFTVQGSQGELFSITDNLSGSLFSVNDISGLPILEVFSDNSVLLGDFQAPAIYTTKKVTTAATSFTVYNGIPTASYDGVWFDYTARSGSNARAGSIMAMWSGSSVNYTETTTTDFGTTADLAFQVLISGSNMALTGSSTNTGWSIKTIIRSI